MRLTFQFSSDTNESWFNDFVENEFLNKYTTEKIGNGVVIDGCYNPNDREALIEEARNLGADMYEHNDDNKRTRVF